MQLVNAAKVTKAPAQEMQIKTGLPRAFDFIASLIALVCSMPLLAVSGITIAGTSSGGVLFKQIRMGRNGRTFTLYKLRTMIPSKSGPQVTSGKDVRITRVGRFLRRSKIDELPTLWNVLRGDMALVGPRPEVPRYVDLTDSRWQLVLKARPGITDPVTLELRNEEELLSQVDGDPEQYYVRELQPLKLNGYLAYLGVRTWRSDLRTLAQTALAVLFPLQYGPSSAWGSTEANDPGSCLRSNNKEHSK